MIEIQAGRTYQLKNGMVVKALYRDRLTQLWVCDNGAVIQDTNVDCQLPDPITDPDGYEITRPDIPKLRLKIGGIYRDRDGDRVEIMYHHVDGGFLGKQLDLDSWGGTLWGFDAFGRCLGGGDVDISNCDLVEEVEPPKLFHVVVNGSFELRCRDAEAARKSAKTILDRLRRDGFEYEFQLIED